ncbi:alpha/beta hydrolase [Salinisphaera sp. SPP-AMP-43]|uniref:alpha/beta fold hydrolase n=1 Tax=Salinisphaera sp. SPP-AMP-43 TaxID=3121288 RepID=UPI003C6E82C8
MKATKVLSAALLAASTAIMPVQSASLAVSQDAHPVPNVVLVHGAFADGSGWRGVYNELTQRRYRVTIVQNPLTSLADDVAATQRVLDRQDGPTILVGHSWGGSVITEAGIHSNVVGLVYVSALAPDVGESTAQQYQGFATPPEFVIDTQKDGFGFLSLEKFKAAFAHDVSDQEIPFLRDSQVPIDTAAFETKLTAAAWRTKPSWAVIATEDRAFDQAMLIYMAQRIGANITQVSASHSVFMTQPKVVADTIERAAKETARTIGQQ